MTAEDWKKAEKMLSMYYSVGLIIDGYKIELILVQDGLKLYIAVYINGKIKCEYITQDCEERRRFYCKTKHCLCNAANKKKAKLTKKEYEQLRKKCTYYSYSPYFSSFRTLKSQFIKNNNSIELIEKDKEISNYD